MSSNVEIQTTADPISIGFLRIFGTIRIFLIIAQCVVRIFEILLDKSLRILNIFIKNWQNILFVIIPLLTIGLIFIEFEIQLKTIFDLAYEVVFYPLYDLFLRNIAIPIRIVYEFLVIRINDFWLYVGECIDVLINDLINIQETVELFSVSGIIQAICALAEFTGECLFTFVTNVCNLRSITGSGYLQNFLSLFTCLVRFGKNFILLLAYTIESLLSDTFVFTEFLEICREFITIGCFCFDNLYEFFTFENLLGPILESIALNPIVFSLPVFLPNGTFVDTDFFNTSTFLPPGFDYQLTPLPIIGNGARDLFKCGALLVKETSVGLLTGTIIANNDYKCPRIQFCEEEDSFPWYVPDFFEREGCQDVSPRRYILRQILPGQSDCLFFVSPFDYRIQIFPKHKVVDITTTTGTSGNQVVQKNIFTARFEENIVINNEEFNDNCAQFDELKIYPQNTTLTCAQTNTTFLNSFILVYQTRYRARASGNNNIIPEAGFDRCLFMESDANHFNVGEVIPPDPEDFFYFETEFPDPSIPSVIGLEVTSGFNAIKPALDCSSTFVGPITRIIQCVFIIIETAVNTYISLQNTIIKLISAAAVAAGGELCDVDGGFSEGGQCFSGSAIDAVGVQDTLNEFEQLLFENQARSLCRIGLGNLLSFKPVTYAIVRATGCDDSSQEIFDLFIEDLLNDGMFFFIFLVLPFF